jgi:hypothetical protein
MEALSSLRLSSLEAAILPLHANAQFMDSGIVPDDFRIIKHNDAIERIRR